MKKRVNGIFTISLDFELYWGMKDILSVEKYRQNLDGTPQAIKQMLKIFDKYNIHATWSTIGFLFFNNLVELQNNYPKKLPKYKNKEIDLYNYANENPNMINSYHFAPALIELIKNSKNQEISTHTFSHYYTLESGQTEKEFYEDLICAKKIAKEMDIKIKSIVFPRNQYNKSYLDIVKQVGISSYRGNENGWIYQAADEKDKKTVIKRGLRIIDSYINISGHHTYKTNDLKKEQPLNITASRFLRPYSKILSFIDKLKLQRIKKSMSYAAKNGELFHLWWHPHNFGKDTEKNIIFLKNILDHYIKLKNRYNFQSLNMNEVSNLLK